MKKYETYRDSGIEWIGEIPSQWNTSQFKFYINLRHGFQFRENDFTDSGIKIVKITQLHKDGYLDISNCSTIDENRLDNFKNILIKENDVLMCLTGGTIGKIIKVGEINEPLLQNYRVGHFSPLNDKTITNSFMFYLMNSEVILGQIFYDVRETGQPNIGLEDMNRMRICIPSIQEQQQIVEFLDTKTSLIDSLIEKTKRKIELLKENRISLINHVVTKGLNPNIELKDSGVEWIGEIPIHWKKKRVKYLIDSQNGIKIGPFGSSLKLDTLTEDGIKIYGQGNVIKDNFELGHRHLPLDRFNESFTQYEIFEGDVLITMMGTTGKSKVFKKDYKRGILDSHLLRLRFDSSKFISDLFVTILQESDYVFNQLKLNSKGSIMDGLNSSIVKELSLMTPPISEQQQIVEYLDKQTNIIDTTVTKEQKRIELLKEYRQSLKSEVATGKIKVCD